MPPTTVQSDAVVWLEPRQARFAAALLRAAGVRCVAFGFPRSASRGELAVEAGAVLGCSESPLADLRHAAATTEARLLLVLTAMGEEGEKPGAVSPLDDPALLSTCKSRGIDVVSTEPLPGSLTDLAWQSESVGGGPLLRQLGMFRRSSVFVQMREAAGALGGTKEAGIGHLRSVSLEFTTGAGAGSLASRLVDACAVIEGLAGLGIVEAVDASVAAPEHAGAVHLALPEKARHLRGDMSMHLRLGNGATGSVVLSDRAGPWRRRVRLVGEVGVIEATDAGVVVLDGEGRAAESGDGLVGARAPGAMSDAEVLGGLMRLEIERREVSEPVNWPGVLGIAEAALLSARTGQNESPETMLRMAGV